MIPFQNKNSQVRFQNSDVKLTDSYINQRFAGGRMQRLIFEVDGVHSDKCKSMLTEELSVMGSKDVQVEVDAKQKKGKVRLSSDREPSLIKLLIESLGNYTVTSHREE